jgi:hypothetical protein
MLRDYKKELRAIREGAQRPSEPRQGVDSRIQCDTPLTEQIEALMRSLPPAQRNRPWTMEELVARLHGRYNARPCAGSVGVALRRLGWTRSRDWSQNGDGRRVWMLC